MRTHRIILAVCFCLPMLFMGIGSTTPPVEPPPAGFFDGFDAPTLDPAWQVYQFTGQRVYGYTSPANHYSLTDRPGFLRYYLNDMTHPDGFLNGYQTTYSEHSCCNHDPGLELHRTFSGDRWTFEARMYAHLPRSNGRTCDTRIYFGDGSPGTYHVRFGRVRDYGYHSIFACLIHQLSQTIGDREILENSGINDGDYSDADTTNYFRLIRDRNILTAFYSRDGSDWTTAFTRDMGTALDGRDQRLTITALTWCNTGNSYADYDYVSLTPQVISCGLNLDPDTLNPRSQGKWITAYITLPDDIDVQGIEVESLRLSYQTAQLTAAWGVVEGAVLAAKFSRPDLEAMLSGAFGQILLKITGTVGGLPFEGTDTITVLSK